MLEKFIENDLENVNKEIARMLKSKDPSMQEIMDYILGAKGKQLRAKMLLAVSRYKGKAKKATVFASIIEIIHMASLVHDDVIDDASKRRGKPSVHTKFGRKMAVYAGDYMIFAVFKKLYKDIEPKYSFIIESLNDVCSGELGQNRNLFNTDVSIDEYLHNIYGKTAVAFEVACRTGAVTSSLPKAKESLFSTYGKCFGMLFQIRDDLLDYQDEVNNAEKNCFQDFVNGIFTLPVIILLKNEAIKPDIEKLVSDFRNKLISEEDVCRRVMSHLKTYNWTDEFYSVCDSYYDEALNSLGKLGDTESTEYLRKMLVQVHNDIYTFAGNVIGNSDI